MRSTIRIAAVIAAASVALTSSVFSAFATAPGLAPSAPNAVVQSAPRSLAAGSPAADCSNMQASDVAWVTLTADHHVDRQVPDYDSGTADITADFRYNCAPANTTIVTIFTLDGLTIFTGKEPIKPKNNIGYYYYALETDDGSPIADGEWGVQFFNNKTLLTTSSVKVGNASEDPSQTSTATVQGVVQDKDSQSPIEGAVILILNPGVTAQDFIQNGKKDSDTYTTIISDSQGAFTLPKKLVRHQVFSMLIVCQGFKSVGNDSFQINDEPDPVSLTIAMTK